MDEETNFQQKFLNFPSSFNLDIEELGKTKIAEFWMKKFYLKDESGEFELTTERTRVLNVFSFLCWKADKRKDALDLNRRALEIEKDNTVARCNQIWMIREDGHLTESKERLNKLESESKGELLLLGKSEIAYSYSVFGSRYFSQSIQLYEELLDNISNKDIPAELTKLWKLDLAIIYRMFCNIGTIEELRWSQENRDDCIKTAAALLYEVACSDSPARWRGRCWASLGELSYSIGRGDGVTKSKAELFPEKIAKEDTENLLNLALITFDKDSVVLNICGKQYKYLKNLQKAEELFNKSLQLRETPYARHHLALVLKMKLIKRISCKPKSQNRNKFRHDLQFQGAQSQASYSQPHVLQKASAKGYDRVILIPAHEKKAVEEIMDHLDKAIEGGNEWGSFEKGLLLREINKPKEARDIFLKTLKMKERILSIPTVSCYEQLGYCCRDLAEREKDAEKQRFLEKDAIEYFRISIKTLAYKVSKELHFLKDGWRAYPTLKDLFRKDENRVERLKELAELSKMLEKHGETLDFYEQIISLDDEQAKDPDIIKGRIQICLKERQFEQAAILLDFNNCTEGKGAISAEFCKFVYLEYAFHLISVDKKEESGERFRQAFAIDYTENSGQVADFDIFLLFDEESETDEDGEIPASVLATKLENFVPGDSGLRVTWNSNKVKPGNWEKQEQTKQMQRSIHIVLVLDTNKEPRGNLEYFIKISQEIDREKIAKLSLILIDECACPLELKAFPRIHVERKLIGCEDDFTKWINRFFFHLLGVHEKKD